MPTRTPPTSNVSRASSVAYDTRAEEYLLSDRVNNVNYLSNSLLDEGYDTAKRSRGRDQQLLKEATNAIPRGSLRDTATLTSSAPSYGSHRFSRRFGKARLRKNESSSLYDSGISGEDRSLPTSDLMASVGPAPNRSWRRYGRARSTSGARSYFGDDDASPDTSAYPSRSSSVGPPLPSRSSILSSSPLSSPHTSRRRLAPFPMTRMSESRVLDSGSSKSWGQSLSPSRLSNYSSPTRPDYDPPYVEYEPDIKSTMLPRRRQKVLGSSRRPAGNYYERLLKKRSKRQGRLGPYYDVESIEGSDLSGVLSDVDSFDGTYDNDSDNESSSVSPSSYRHLSTALSPSSPYYVDQDTEFVPFKPSRPLQTKGLLEFSSYDDDDNNDESSNSQPLPSPTTDLYLSRYLPSSLVSAATSASSPTLSRLPYHSVVPYTSSLSDDSLGVVPSSTPTASQQLLDSLVSTSVQRAKNALNNLAIPEYSGASLLLSVEGAGLSPEGKRVDFTYTPPPIPLYGRTLALDDKILGIRPSSTIKPLDNFISGYVERMGALRAALSDRLDKDKEKRIQYGLKPLDTGPRPSRTYSSYTPSYSSSYVPSYTQSYEYVPVKHVTSQKLERLPVTTFRRRQDDGHTQRLDVFSLGEFRPRLSSSTAREISIPASATGGHQLSVLDKINIKAAIIASKLEPDPLKRRRPRSEYAANKYRELRKESQESASGGSSQSGPYGSSMVEAPRIKSAMKKKSRFLGKGTTTVATFKFPGPYDTDIQLKAPKKGSVRFDLKESEDDRSGGGADEYLDTSGVEASSRPVSDLRRRIRRTLNKSRLS